MHLAHAQAPARTSREIQYVGPPNSHIVLFLQIFLKRAAKLLETPQLGFREFSKNPAEPDLALHQSLPHLLRNLFRNPVERDLALHQSLSNLLQNLRNLRNLLRNLVEPDPAPAPVYTGAILGWRSHLAYAVGEKLKNKKIKKDALVLFSFWCGANYCAISYRTCKQLTESHEHGIIKNGMHVFWAWAPLFWTCTCFLDLAGFFFWTWGHKKCRGRACVFSGPCGDIFFGPACICAGPRAIFLRQPN